MVSSQVDTPENSQKDFGMHRKWSALMAEYWLAECMVSKVKDQDASLIWGKTSKQGR